MPSSRNKITIAWRTFGFFVFVIAASLRADGVRSFYHPPQSYSTTRDPDVPKYARHAPDTDYDLLQHANWLDIGLDYRFRFEYRDDDIRRPVGGLDTPFLHRTRAYLGVHDVLDPFRFAVELQDSRRYGSDFERDNRDINEFELIRLQAELYFDDWLDKDDLGNKRPVFVRYGIQNFEFLDRRLIGNNQWRNTANTGLGFRAAIGQDDNDWSLDLLAIQPLERQLYEWDEPLDGQWVYAIIGHWRRWSEFITLEPFYLALDQKTTSETAARTVHSPGFRAYGTVADSGFDFDFSVIRQFGDNDGRNIDAWGGTAEVGYRFKLPWKPRLSAFYGYASGDKDPNDNEDNRFERFYGFGRPWSANDYIVYENIKAPKLRVELTPSDKLRIDFGYNWYSLASSSDRFYAADKVQDKTGRSGDSIGHEFDIRARWQVTKKLELIAGYAHFTAGDFTRNAIRPGDTDFAYLECNLVLF
ncbi:MAG: alginate export family protein [Verrucomicrobiaceae bacterium]|nr:alginate export family protein [Verrucomicrobiaceae bacterium]